MIKRNLNRIALILVFIRIFDAKSQSNSHWHFSIEEQTTFAAAGRLPFWFRANQYGSIPPAGVSAGTIGSIYRDYDTTKSHSWNWSVGMQARVNVGIKSNITLIEAFIKAKKGIFEFSGGRTRDVSGIADTALSSGSFAISGNALGIPKLTIAIPDYYSLPIFNKLIAIKGNYSLGYLGSVDVASTTSVNRFTQYYQQNSFYGRIGREDWKLKLFGGINHQVMYGNERAIFGPQYMLNNLQATIYAAIGKTYHPPNIQYDYHLGGKVGNHVGSIDIGGQYDFTNINVMFYHQFIYDVGAIGHFANLNDGVSGISIKNKLKNRNKIKWSKLLVEFVATKDQAGGPNSRSLSGDEDYYNDFEFTNGWSYYGVNLGNPLLASRMYTRNNLLNYAADYVIDNRILALNTGFKGAVNNIAITMKLTFSKNYGTYATSMYGHTTGVRHYASVGVFGDVNQFSGYVEGSKKFSDEFCVGVAVAYDNDGLYYNSPGLQLKLKKSFN